MKCSEGCKRLNNLAVKLKERNEKENDQRKKYEREFNIEGINRICSMLKLFDNQEIADSLKEKFKKIPAMISEIDDPDRIISRSEILELDYAVNLEYKPYMNQQREKASSGMWPIDGETATWILTVVLAVLTISASFIFLIINKFDVNKMNLDYIQWLIDLIGSGLTIIAFIIYMVFHIIRKKKFEKKSTFRCGGYEFTYAELKQYNSGINMKRTKVEDSIVQVINSHKTNNDVNKVEQCTEPTATGNSGIIIEDSKVKNSHIQVDNSQNKTENINKEINIKKNKGDMYF